jgi:replicative superfamily II helicase
VQAVLNLSTITASNSKTNVAMLTVVSHLRNVGLIDPGSSGLTDAGKKVVYIAPMKALAQEVVEKFSSKLKPLGMIVRELTGDMQLTRAAAEAANILVTTPEKWDGEFDHHCGIAGCRRPSVLINLSFACHLVTFSRHPQVGH